MDLIQNINNKIKDLNKFNTFVWEIEKTQLKAFWGDLFNTKEEFFNWLIKTADSFSNINNYYNFLDDIIDNKKCLYICWDYDADGICSTVLFSEFCDEVNIKYKPFIPNRVEDWYWLNNKSLIKLLNLWLWDSNDSVISIDNGVNNFDIKNKLSQLNINYHIIDHHQESKKGINNDIDQSIYQINPHLKENKWNLLINENNICTGMLLLITSAWYIDRKFWTVKAKLFVEKNFDLALITTVTDMMPVTWINRSLIKLYKDNLLHTDNLRPSIKTLFADWLQSWSISFDQEDSNSNDIHKYIGWTVWPIINSLWRISNPMVMYDYLKNWEWSLDTLKEINNYRKQITWTYRKKIESSSIEQLKWKAKYFLHILDESDTFTPGIQSILSWSLSSGYNKIVWVWYQVNNDVRFSFRCPKWINLKQLFTDSEFNYKWHNEAWVIHIKKDELTSLNNFFSNQPLDKKGIHKDIPTFLPYKLTPNLIDIRTIHILNSHWPYWLWNHKPEFLIKWTLLKQSINKWTGYLSYTDWGYERIKILVGSKKVTMYNFWGRITEDELFNCKSFIWTLEKPFNEFSTTPIIIISKFIYD